MNSKFNDVSFGMAQEDDILPLIKEYWKDEPNIIKTKNKYCIYDFISDNGTTWELKSRRNHKDKYPTTIIPCHKLNNKSVNQYYIFNFIDGLYYIKYDIELFKTFKVKPVKYERIGGNPNAVPHYEIPVDLLTEIKI